MLTKNFTSIVDLIDTIIPLVEERVNLDKKIDPQGGLCYLSFLLMTWGEFSRSEKQFFDNWIARVGPEEISNGYQWTPYDWQVRLDFLKEQRKYPLGKPIGKVF